MSAKSLLPPRLVSQFNPLAICRMQFACLGSDGLILIAQELGAEFFVLRNGLAGELFQKFMNYQTPLAVVLPDFAAYGERFGELAYEHSAHPQIRFVHTQAEAMAWLKT